MEHPTPIDPRDHAVYSPEKMGKSTLFRSEWVMVGLNAFEPGQEHAVHTHAGMDKVYQVIEGQGLFLLGGDEVPMQAGFCWSRQKECLMASATPAPSGCSCSPYSRRRHSA